MAKIDKILRIIGYVMDFIVWVTDHLKNVGKSKEESK